MPLNIAFIGYNAQQTMTYLGQLVRDNITQVKFYNKSKGRVILKDGTTIEAILKPLDGKRYDQVIIADDRRREVEYHRQAEIAWLRYTTTFSIIAEEFRFQYYDLDAEEE